MNWSVGDSIVIASSSFYTDESEEVSERRGHVGWLPRARSSTVHHGCCPPQAVIAWIDVDTYYNVSTIGLDRQLQYTHLGIIEPIANGYASNAVIDMRAEVAVLSRNVIFQVSASIVLRKGERLCIFGGQAFTSPSVVLRCAGR